MGQPDDSKTMPAGRRLRLRCTTPDCWVDGIDVSSRGGVLRPQGPQCPHCRSPVAAESDWGGSEPILLSSLSL